MTLSGILILFVLFTIISFLQDRKLQSRLLTALSVFFVFALQPIVPIRNFDFWFPFLTIALSLICWAFSVSYAGEQTHDQSAWRVDFVIIFGTILLIALSRIIGNGDLITASRPPILERSLSGILLLMVFLLWALRQKANPEKWVHSLLIVLILFLLLLLKEPHLAAQTSSVLRRISGQSIETAVASDLRWLGFSYIAFRLLSVIIERRKGRMVQVSPGVFLTYTIFPATLAAGPIDRLDHFSKEVLKSTVDRSADLSIACQRVAGGLFKKFILADSLARMSLSAQNSAQVQSAGWAWLVLVAYSFQIYFDFSGYSDIAIGLARLISIQIPENFNHPYLKPDIAKFWNNWHMTLTQWIRTYVFNPLIRLFRSSKKIRLPQWLIILIMQLVTMGLIGLWHGVTLNFLIWGCWHAVGLFIHQLYYDRMKNFILGMQQTNQMAYRVYSGISTILTFVFVSLGWIWFVLPTPTDAIVFLGKLVGI